MFGQLLDISHRNFIFSKAFSLEFCYSGVWFTDQNSSPLEKEGKINNTLVIDWSITHKNDTLFSSTKGFRNKWRNT